MHAAWWWITRLASAGMNGLSRAFPPTSSTVKCAYATISLLGLHVRGVATIELMGHLQIYSTSDTYRSITTHVTFVPVKCFRINALLKTPSDWSLRGPITLATAWRQGLRWLFYLTSPGREREKTLKTKKNRTNFWFSVCLSTSVCSWIHIAFGWPWISRNATREAANCCQGHHSICWSQQFQCRIQVLFICQHGTVYSQISTR